MSVFPQRDGAGAMVRHGPTSLRAGQSLIESCLVLAIVCLAFFGAFQISQLYASQEILNYAAARGARAKVVGFNRFMVFKTIRVGAIPNAGRLLNPATPGGPAAQHALEAARIPLYMGAENEGDLGAVLNYADWDTLQYDPFPAPLADGTLQLDVRQSVPLHYALHRAFYAADSLDLSGAACLDNHYTLYLDDMNW